MYLIERQYYVTHHEQSLDLDALDATALGFTTDHKRLDKTKAVLSILKQTICLSKI